MNEPTITTIKLHPASQNDPFLKKALLVFTAWVNQHLEFSKATVQNLVDDLSNVQTLELFLGIRAFDSMIASLTSENLNESGSKQEKAQKLGRFIQDNLNIPQDTWTMDGILNKDISSILILLARLATKFDRTLDLPENLVVSLMHNEVFAKMSKTRTTRHTVIEKWVQEKILIEPHFKPLVTRVDDNSQDPFYVLLTDKEDEKKITQIFIQEFIDKEFEGMHPPIKDLALDFKNGVYLVHLLGCIFNEFISPNKYVYNPTTDRERMENFRFAMGFMEEHGISNKDVDIKAFLHGHVIGICKSLYAILDHRLKELSK